MLITDAELLRQVDAFIERTGISPTRFGLDTLGDGNLIKSLREGRSLSLKNAQKVVVFMAEYQPPASPAEQAA